MQKKHAIITLIMGIILTKIKATTQFEVVKMIVHTINTQTYARREVNEKENRLNLTLT